MDSGDGGFDGLDAASATLLALAHVARLEVDALDEDLALGREHLDDAALLALVAGLQGLEALLGAAGVALGQRLLVGRASANASTRSFLRILAAMDQITSGAEGGRYA